MELSKLKTLAKGFVDSKAKDPEVKPSADKRRTKSRPLKNEDLLKMDSEMFQEKEASKFDEEK